MKQMNNMATKKMLNHAISTHAHVQQLITFTLSLMLFCPVGTLKTRNALDHAVKVDQSYILPFKASGYFEDFILHLPLNSSFPLCIPMQIID